MYGFINELKITSESNEEREIERERERTEISMK
jgi:hypothetical protein